MTTGIKCASVQGDRNWHSSSACEYVCVFEVEEPGRDSTKKRLRKQDWTKLCCFIFHIDVSKIQTTTFTVNLYLKKMTSKKKRKWNEKAFIVPFIYAIRICNIQPQVSCHFLFPPSQYTQYTFLKSITPLSESGQSSRGSDMCTLTHHSSTSAIQFYHYTSNLMYLDFNKHLHLKMLFGDMWGLFSEKQRWRFLNERYVLFNSCCVSEQDVCVLANWKCTG